MIGYLPEIPPLYTDMTVREYLMFAAELKGIARPKRQEAVELAEKTVRIDDVSPRLIENLSKGYRQRVGFAQAILGLPEVLILDEPTAGLDPKQIIEVRDLIRELGENHTIILSSHILSEVSAICDKIMIISRGKLIACDTPEDARGTRASDKLQLKIRVKGDEETVNGVLSGLSGISGYGLRESGEEGVLLAEIEYEHGKDIRDAAAMAFAQAKCLVVGLSEESASLEDVFLELTESEEAEHPQEENGEESALADLCEEDTESEPESETSLSDTDDGGDFSVAEEREEDENESHI